MKTFTDYGIIILNSCLTSGDEDENFTLMSETGQSVIDLCAVNQKLIGMIESFNVDEKVV